MIDNRVRVSEKEKKVTFLKILLIVIKCCNVPKENSGNYNNCHDLRRCIFNSVSTTFVFTGPELKKLYQK